MSTGTDVAAQVERAGLQSVAHPAVKALARAGYVAKAAVYAVIGGLALQLAIGGGGRTTDSRGAIATIAQGPVGRVLVAALAIGLVGRALWFLLEALADPSGRHRSGAKAIAARLGKVVVALGSASLALAAVRLAFGGAPGRGGDAAAVSWTGRALELPAGRFLVAALGIVIVVVGARQAWRGIGRKFLRDLELGGMGARTRTWAPRLGVAGFATQGAVFVLVGLFLAQAALTQDPREATGLDGALETLARQPFGVFLLAAAALGFLAYAAFALVEGRHRKLLAP
jgi:hypothetical protein